MTAKLSGLAGFVATLGAVYMALFANEATASCSTRDALRNNTSLDGCRSALSHPSQILSAAVPVWKTIGMGTFASNVAIRNAFRSADYGLGDSAERMLAQLNFNLSMTKTNVDLVALSLTELGFETQGAPLAAIYSRAQKLGFELAPAEVGPQLRLQYFDQPVGEFLDIGMAPIKPQEGEPGIFIVANGGAGLVLIGRNAGSDAEAHAPSRFVFVRPPIFATGQK